MNQINLWIGFHVLVLALLALDLGVFHRRAHKIKLQGAILWSLFWISVSLLFNLFIYFEMGREAALQFLTGYLIEKSLSVDNLFVILVIFSMFHVPKMYQHKVLFFGILGAMMMRVIFILAGITLISRFEWMIYPFGLLLCVTAIRLLVQKEQVSSKENFVTRWCKRHLAMKEGFEEGNFFIREKGKTFITQLFIVLIMIETTDLIFATDSIPAIFSVTKDPFIVYTSNIFAILGLRALHFVLAEFMDRFHYLKVGLSAILMFTGMKMLFSHIVEIPIEWALSVVLFILALSVIASLSRKMKKGNDERENEER